MRLLDERGYKQINCILVGDGDELNTLREMTNRYNLTERVIFTGKVKHDKVVMYINGFDVCVAPFRSERNSQIGLSPLKLYEYLACAKPVITSRIEGGAQLIEQGNCGYLVEPNSVDELAETIIKCYNDRKNLTNIGLNGRQLVEKKYSWRKIAGDTQKILEEVKLSSNSNRKQR